MLSVQAQPPAKEYKIGQAFNITLPGYLSKTLGLNDAAVVQYKSDEKAVYGFVIQDLKEELKLAGVDYASINAFYEDFMKDFATDEKNKRIGKPLSQTKNGINFIEVDYSFYSEEAKMNIYYLVGIVETKNAYYKVLSWCAAEDKQKFKADFQKILYSVKE